MPSRKPSTLDNTRVACYARVSTEDQAERDTVAAQTDFLRRYCELHGLPVAGLYVDDGISGTTPLDERPAGQRLLADAEAGAFGTVLVYRLDRLGRSLTALLAAHDRLDAAGVAIRSGTEPFDTASPIGKFLFSLLGSMAELERSTVSERMTRGRNRVASTGRYTGGPIPTGYDLDANGLLIPSERIMPVLGITEAEYVRDLFHRVAAREITLMAEASRLNALGVPRVIRYGGPKARILTAPEWQHNAITRIVHNSTYHGASRVRSKFGTVERPCPPLVDVATWDQAQAATTANRALSKKNANATYLLRGLIRCGLCGRSYSGNAGPGDRARYRCTSQSGSRHRAGIERCASALVGVRDLDAAVWAHVRAVVADPEPYVKAVERRLLTRRASSEAVAKEAPLAAELAAKSGERERVLSLHRRGIISADEAERELDQIKRETDGIRELLDAIRVQASAVEAQRVYVADTLAMLTGFAERVAEIDAGNDPSGQRELIVAIVKRVVIDTEVTGLTRGGRRRLRTTTHIYFVWDADTER